MRIDAHQSFDEYFRAADEAATDIWESNSSFIGAFRRVHCFFLQHIFSVDPAFSPVQAALVMNGFMIYLSAIRVAVSGHAAATYPLLRTALESCCYAFLTGEEPQLGAVWLNRHTSSRARNICRKRFTSAVRQTARMVQRQPRVSAGTENWINSMYDATIDYGAHPNPKSVLTHSHTIGERKDGSVGLRLVAVHSTDSVEVSRSLLACLESGLAISLILLCSLPKKTDSAMISLHELSRLKDRLVDEIVKQ